MTRLINLLSERQKEALRLALTMTSDQIAAELIRRGEAVTTKAVNGRIDAAREKLGGLTRRQAAELLAIEEGRLDPEHARADRDKIPKPKNPIPSNGLFPSPRPSPQSDEPSEPYPALSEAGQAEGRRNPLDVWQRLGIVLLAMAVLAAAASGYIAALRR